MTGIMNKMYRTEAPQWLADNWESWGREWKQLYDTQKNSSRFRWRSSNGKGKNELTDALNQLTKRHCSFCDAYPMGSRIQNTIEHFRPKTKFPLLAFHWENLFICCQRCQEKGDAFTDLLLKPDEETYNFDAYFEIDWSTGEIKPNGLSSAEMQQRAITTIELYKFNKHGKPEDRLEELAKYLDSRNPDINKFPYRFFLERGSFTSDD